jgi:hypothetical protein
VIGGGHALILDNLNLKAVWPDLVMGKGGKTTIMVFGTYFLVAHGFITHGFHVMNPLQGLRILH